MRHANNLVSIVLVKGREGCEAYVRFNNPRLDILITGRTVNKVMDILYQKVRW